jgi:hypothetical protein
MDGDDGKHLAETMQTLNEVPPWSARINTAGFLVQPAPGSSLRGDDNKASPYDVSHAVRRHLTTAVDHLGCLLVLLGAVKLVPMYAPFTLLRAALENACGAIWLLEPSQRPERLARRFRLALADVHHNEEAKQLAGQQGPRTEQERKDQIHDIARRADIDDAALKGSTSYSAIVRAVDQSSQADNLFEVAWKLCSAYAHGDMWATLSSSALTPIPGATEPGYGNFKVEASVSTLKYMTTVAVMATTRAWELHDLRCQPPY